MSFKISNEKFQELYDPENKQYTDEEKNKLFNDELSNIIKRYIFGLQNTYPPRYPILGFHTEEYCELYVKHTISDLNRDLPYEKIEYLLTSTDSNDKSLFFNLIGYKNNENGRNELFIQIMKGLDFGNIKFLKLNKYGIFVDIPANIYSKRRNKIIKIPTVWKYDKNRMFHFITAFTKNVG